MAWVQILGWQRIIESLWTDLYCNKEFFKQASTTAGDILWMFLCEWKKNIFKKEPSKIDLRGSRTHFLVITRPLLYHLHHHFLLQSNILFITSKSCLFWFVDSPFCCKCSYDIQQEDICIKPRSIRFQVWKVLLVEIRLKKQSSPKLQNVWRNGTLVHWTSSFLL